MRVEPAATASIGPAASLRATSSLLQRLGQVSAHCEDRGFATGAAEAQVLRVLSLGAAGGRGAQVRGCSIAARCSARHCRAHPPIIPARSALPAAKHAAPRPPCSPNYSSQSRRPPWALLTGFDLLQCEKSRAGQNAAEDWVRS